MESYERRRKADRPEYRGDEAWRNPPCLIRQDVAEVPT